MKDLKTLLASILSYLLLSGSPSAADTLDLFLLQMQADQKIIFQQKLHRQKPLRKELSLTEMAIQESIRKNIPDLRQHLQLQHRKEQLDRELNLIDHAFELNLTRLRYKKGLELIRLLYEKILALDHHFSSLQVQQHITSISNPNSYPAFRDAQQKLLQQQKKDHAIKLPTILQNNPYLSTTFSLISSVLGSKNNGEREEELSNIACILDFTARMHSELSTIYYETEYLRQNNSDLKSACIELFSDYMKVIDYHTPLDKCRREDDWDRVYSAIDALFRELEEEMESDDEIIRNHLYKQIINLEFSVDRLINFINRYNAFISQGEKYYQKFLVIVQNYPNEEPCREQLPREFSQLKQDIEFSISKFNEAYNISALRGSKLKDLLYGFSE